MLITYNELKNMGATKRLLDYTELLFYHMEPWERLQIFQVETEKLLQDPLIDKESLDWLTKHSNKEKISPQVTLFNHVLRDPKDVDRDIKHLNCGHDENCRCPYCHVEYKTGLGSSKICFWICPICGHEKVETGSWKMAGEPPIHPCQCVNCKKKQLRYDLMDNCPLEKVLDLFTINLLDAIQKNISPDKDMALDVTALRDDARRSIRKLMLGVMSQIREIISENPPSIAEDSGQPEYCAIELDRIMSQIESEINKITGGE